MLTSTLAETLLLSCPNLHRPSQTTDSAKEDHRGNRPNIFTTKDVIPHIKEEEQNEKSNYIAICK
jgi:hypothetical protein